MYFVSSTGALAALSATTGEPRWVCAVEGERRFEAKGLHGYPPASQTMPDAWDVFTSSPAVSDGLVFFGAGDGGVYAVEAATGVLQWAFRTGNVVHASPAVAGGIVYVGSWDSRVYALEARTGVLKWSFQAGLDPAIHNQEGFQSSCAVAGGVVLGEEHFLARPLQGAPLSYVALQRAQHAIGVVLRVVVLQLAQQRDGHQVWRALEQRHDLAVPDRGKRIDARAPVTTGCLRRQRGGTINASCAALADAGLGSGQLNHQVGVGALEPQVLEALDLVHALGQSRVALAPNALSRHLMQALQDAFGLRVHVSRRSASGHFMAWFMPGVSSLPLGYRRPTMQHCRA